MEQFFELMNSYGLQTIVSGLAIAFAFQFIKEKTSVNDLEQALNQSLIQNTEIIKEVQQLTKQTNDLIKQQNSTLSLLLKLNELGIELKDEVNETEVEDHDEGTI